MVLYKLMIIGSVFFNNLYNPFLPIISFEDTRKPKAFDVFRWIKKGRWEEKAQGNVLV